MHQESLALTSMLSCRTGLPQECYQNPDGDKNKMEGQHCMPQLLFQKKVVKQPAKHLPGLEIATNTVAFAT